MRFGIGMNTDHTLEEVGQQFDVTRERIRQIEAKALRKMRDPHPSSPPRSEPGRGEAPQPGWVSAWRGDRDGSAGGGLAGPQILAQLLRRPGVRSLDPRLAMRHDPQSTPEEEAADPAWKLLGKGPAPEPPPFFAAKVMRQIAAMERPAPAPWWIRWARSPVAPALAAAAVVLLVVLGLPAPAPSPLADASPAPSLSADDLEIIADLDQLIAYEESATWLDSPSY
jgi:hypothetical protein